MIHIVEVCMDPTLLTRTDPCNQTPIMEYQTINTKAIVDVYAVAISRDLRVFFWYNEVEKKIYYVALGSNSIKGDLVPLVLVCPCRFKIVQIWF